MKRILRKGFILDCDGVLYHGNKQLPGAYDFIKFLHSNSLPHLFLTNAATHTRTSLVKKFDSLFPGLTFTKDHFFTAAISTAIFLSSISGDSNVSAFVVGDRSLVDTLKKYNVDVRESFETAPDYVVIGETGSDDVFKYSSVQEASKYVLNGAKLIGTNEDVGDRIGDTLVPGTGSLASVVEQTTGRKCYFLGKPNRLMIDAGVDLLGVEKKDVIFVGDRMDTDIRGAVEAGIDSILVLSGVSKKEEVHLFPYQPKAVLEGVGDVEKWFSH
eukprot:snap_masked-scaffold_12-processed-gene-10.43-mRNA-1 protein AED:0.35 eAED:0.35 QI:0/-1/0/1/-1/1/1/0/270